jgi:hypothetical protein
MSEFEQRERGQVAVVMVGSPRRRKGVFLHQYQSAQASTISERTETL